MFVKGYRCVESEALIEGLAPQILMSKLCIDLCRLYENFWTVLTGPDGDEHG